MIIDDVKVIRKTSFVSECNPVFYTKPDPVVNMENWYKLPCPIN